MGKHNLKKIGKMGQMRNGGILISMKTTYDCVFIDHESDYELTFIDLIINGTTLNFFVAYRLPSQTLIAYIISHLTSLI